MSRIVELIEPPQWNRWPHLGRLAYAVSLTLAITLSSVGAATIYTWLNPSGNVCQVKLHVHAPAPNDPLGIR